MLSNPTLREFEAMVTMRALLSSTDYLQSKKEAQVITIKETFTYDEAVKVVYYAAGGILKDLRVNNELWVLISEDKRRVFMYHVGSRVVIGELGIITERAGTFVRKRLQVMVVHDERLPQTIGDIMTEAMKRYGESRPRYSGGNRFRTRR